MEYLYRVVYRLKREYWQNPEDKEWKVWCSSTNPTGRPYKNAPAVKSIVSQNNYPSMRFEFKAQKFPLTQEWVDING